jgi:hypothetical protein
MPATLEADLETIAPPGNPDDFVVIEDRPVWHEHWTREGRDASGELETESVFMGPDELKQVAENCNERIRDTGDFVPLVINHTKDDGSEDPELIGFAGPFIVDRFGKDGKATIFAKKFWVFKSDYEKFRKHPRVSVEYWSSKSDPTNGVLDPISCLGATTPELDLGIRYGRTSDGVQILRYARESGFVERYEATAAPGGSNTYVAGLTDCDEDDERHLKYQANEGGNMGSGGPMSAEALNQFVEAMKPVIKAIVEEQVLAMKDPAPDVVDPDAVPTEPMDPMAGDMGEGMPGEDMSPGMEGEMPPGDGMPGEDSSPADLADTDLEAGPLDDDDDDDDFEDDVDVVDDDEEDQPHRYSAAHPPDAASESLDQPQHLLEGAMSLTEDAKKTVQKYQKERDDSVAKYQKEVAAHRDTVAKYEKLKTEVDGYKLKEMRATRYAKIAALVSDGVVADPDEEIKDIMGENGGQALTDEQFEKHCERMVTKYSRVPINRTLPQDKPEKVKLEKATDPKVREKYKKQAIAAVNLARKKGETTTFEAELKKAQAADTESAAA